MIFTFRSFPLGPACLPIPRDSSIDWRSRGAIALFAATHPQSSLQRRSNLLPAGALALHRLLSAENVPPAY